MKAYKPQDATTNPSLILQASQKAEYKSRRSGHRRAQEQLPHRRSQSRGRHGPHPHPLRSRNPQHRRCVSTEVDARLSFDTQGNLDKARQLISMYEAAGIGRERILIKIASTWKASKPPKTS